MISLRYHNDTESTVTDLLIRQIPDDLHAKLKQSARANRRSVNQEVIVLLEQTLAE